MLATLANHVWQSTLFAAVVGVLILALRNNAAHLRYWLWMAASLKFAVPFSLLVTFGAHLSTQIEWYPAALEPHGLSMPQDWTDFASAVVQPAANFTAVPSAAPTANGAASMWTIESIALEVWAIGFAVVMAIWFYRWIRLRNLLQTAKPFLFEEYRDLGFPLPIKCVREPIEPGIVGIFGPILLLPEGLLERLTRNQIQAIFAHERCHFERRDNLTAALHMLVEAVFWFHPIVWWIGARLIEEREHACDAAVLNAGNDPETYASGILDVCQHYVAAPLDCVAGVSGADLKKRVRSIMTHRGEARVHIMKWLLLAAVAMSVVISPVLVGALTAPRAEAIETPQAGDEYKNVWPTIASSSISVSQAEEGVGQSLLINPNGTFSTRNWSLRGVIAWAYGIQDSEIDEPSASTTDLASTRYNIIALTKELSKDNLVAQNQFRLLTRRLLDEKFGLSFHWEEHRVPVYTLSVGVPDSGIRPAKPEDPGPLQTRGLNSVTGRAVPLLLFKQFLAHTLRRPIVDETGLTGRFNFVVKWGPERGEPGVSTDPAAAYMPKNPTPEQLIEAVQNQLGLTLTSQDGTVKRMVVDHLEQPADLKTNPKEILLSQDVFDRYTGYYDFPQNLVMTISRNGDKLFSQLTGQGPLQIYASAERDFFAKNVDATATFSIDDAGNVIGLVLKQNGREIFAPRLHEAIAKARMEALKVRIRDRVRQPGSEALLRQYFVSLHDDIPAYQLMTPEVADALRTEWPEVKARYAKLGELQLISLKLVDPTGADVYWVAFENGSYEWRIGLNPSGKIDRLNYRRLPQP